MSEPVILLDKVDLTLGQRSGARPCAARRRLSPSRRGESIGLVGPSGSGKSTLLMVMAGLERIDAGRVVVAGQDYCRRSTRTRSPASAAGEIGFVFQAFHLIETMTALENVAVPLELAGRAGRVRAGARNPRAGRPRRAALPLSGAALRRRAAARRHRARPRHDPAILIADEPTGNLDAATGREIVDLLFGAVAEQRHDARARHA